MLIGKNMSQKDQAKYFEKLKRFQNKFDMKELSEYKMLVKRHKDDEDLDKISLGKLQTLLEKYYLNREKQSFDHIFKKNNETDAE